MLHNQKTEKEALREMFQMYIDLNSKNPLKQS